MLTLENIDISKRKNCAIMQIMAIIAHQLHTLLTDCSHDDIIFMYISVEEVR